MPGTERAVTGIPDIVMEKLLAFDRLEARFTAGFQYVQQVQGERRFERMPIEATVRYLHALWVCECKDRLLTVPRTIERYEGVHVLRLLDGWQRGDAAAVVLYLQLKLGNPPFAGVARQWQEAQSAGPSSPRAQRLAHGWRNIVNRAANLNAMLDAILGIPLTDSVEQARVACDALELTPAGIAARLAALETPLYAPFAHPVLARKNMVVMNAQGVLVTSALADRPGERTSAVRERTMPAGPYAEEVIVGEVEMTPPPYSTYRYMPAAETVREVMNNPDAPPEPTTEVDIHPDPRGC